MGLLFQMTVRIAWDVPWDVLKVLFGAAVIAALFRKANIPPVVPAGSILSVLIFR